MRVLLKTIFLLGICVCGCVAWSQDNSGLPVPAAVDPYAQTLSADANALQANAAQLPDGTQVRQLGRANFITSDVGLAHLGPITLGTTTISESEQRGSAFTNTQASSRTNLMAESTFHRNGW
jgi:hypothetical protein